ncbi:MAG: aminopeptidase P N-terminal domain-containing protein [Alphaproteobacteria bacterium]|nr:aminopeptidase P N-terminal domain-containing protein [Alphaproteobacteria bacterium]
MTPSESERAFFADRRQRVLERLSPGEAMLIFGSHHHLRNGDSEFAYRQDSDLWYLSGWPDPEAALLLKPGAEEPERIFVQPKDREREIWTGIRPGPEGAIADYGVAAAGEIADLPEALKEALVGVHTLHYRIGEDPDRDRLVLGSIARANRPARDAFQPIPDAFVHPKRILGELRLFKTPQEMAWLREASRITAEAHAEAMAFAEPGRMEYELSALIDYRFRQGGGNGPGYTSIVGGGANACILHYITNDSALQAGDLVLIDAGCEYRNYTADVTRTFPVSGRFTEPQARVYEWVLKAQLACIDACRPGSTFKDVHDTAVRILTEGMVDLGLLEGEVDALIEEKAFKKYYMHGTSHWLGIDVHDVGAYVADGGSRPLEAGMLLTVEPGLYIAPDDADAPEALRGIGIRIEDDVLVTQGAPEVLTEACPKHLAEVEAACGLKAAAK